MRNVVLGNVVLYLIIIVIGILGEMVVQGRLIVGGSARPGRRRGGYLITTTR